MAIDHTNSGIRSGFIFCGFLLIFVLKFMLKEWKTLLLSEVRRWLHAPACAIALARGA
jgi:hypothetical protein